MALQPTCCKIDKVAGEFRSCWAIEPTDHFKQKYVASYRSYDRVENGMGASEVCNGPDHKHIVTTGQATIMRQRLKLAILTPLEMLRIVAHEYQENCLPSITGPIASLGGNNGQRLCNNSQGRKRGLHSVLIRS